jgi:low temperature requirement protein LtrA
LSRHFKKLVARDRDESHRAATQLELLFDLVAVIAIAAAAHGLRHELSHGHVGTGIACFLLAFFCIWWPWNIFTWFASSFDNDDAGYRVNVMAIMFGAMMVAASMPGFFEFQTLTYAYIGYVIMRLALAVLWMRAGRANPQFWKTALRYSLGQILLQGPWAIVVFVLEPRSTPFWICFLLGVAAELFVPWYAERAQPTHWHRHHITERFGLLNIIVLGEVLLGSTEALETSITEGLDASLLSIALGGSVIVFSMWWMYFSESEHLSSQDVKHVFGWAYGHFLVFAAAAAAGAGLGVMLDARSEPGLSLIASLSVSLPVAAYVVGLWIVRERHLLKRSHSWTLLVFAALIAATGFLPHAPVPTALMLLVALVVRLRIAQRAHAVTSELAT